MMIKYWISPNLFLHTYNVLLTFTAKNSIEEIKLPTWIPGSYMIREFSKNIITIRVSQLDNPEINLVQKTKNSWTISNIDCNKEVEVSYEVYAYEAGIRTAHIDSMRGYFNPTSLCIYIDNYVNLVHQVNIINLPKSWKIGVALNKCLVNENCYHAKNYHELIDSPFELGTFKTFEFNINSINYEFIISGIMTDNMDFTRFIKDVQIICAEIVSLFKNQIPFKKYVFILNLSGELCTGLEHKSSTLLLAPFSYMILKNQVKKTDNYIKLLGLISHEFFHAWNVKTITPRKFLPHDLESEVYTPLLWWFEGATSYYDDLSLLRAGVIDNETYLNLLADTINSVYSVSGINKQSIASSSFNAWIKYYMQNENSPNAIVSYYTKGSLVCLYLDLFIQVKSNYKYNLDYILNRLWREAQSITYKGIDDDTILNIIENECEIEIKELYNTLVYGCGIIDFDDLFMSSGLKLIKDEDFKINLGMKFAKTPNGIKITNIYDNIYNAKKLKINRNNQIVDLAPGDIIIAINDTKFTDEGQLQNFQDKDSVKFTFFRGDMLLESVIELQIMNIGKYRVILNDENLFNKLFKADATC